MNRVKKMWAALVGAFKWVKSIVSEQDGLGSASRIAKLSIIGSSVFCIVFVTLKTGQLPPAEELKALAEVITAGTVGYAANQLKEALSKDKGDS